MTDTNADRGALAAWNRLQGDRRVAQPAPGPNPLDLGDPDGAGTSRPEAAVPAVVPDPAPVGTPDADEPDIDISAETPAAETPPAQSPAGESPAGVPDTSPSVTGTLREAPHRHLPIPGRGML